MNRKVKKYLEQKYGKPMKDKPLKYYLPESSSRRRYYFNMLLALMVLLVMAIVDGLNPSVWMEIWRENKRFRHNRRVMRLHSPPSKLW